MKLIFALVLLAAPSAFACGPWGCYPQACLTYGPDSIEYVELDTCGQEQLTHLDPNNITETNFELLGWELSGANPRGENSSSSYDPGPERTDEALPPEESRTPFYKGIASFRAEDYDKAIEFFKQPTNSDIDTPKAAYYIGRSYLRWSQKGYDGYNGTQINKDYAIKARDAFRAFAKKYPDHEWASSATGLARRASWLGSDLEGFSADWGARVDDELANRPRNEDAIILLFLEASRMNLKSLTETNHLHPVLWMIRSYYVTRQFHDGDPLTFDLNVQLKALDADQASFAKYKDLYAWSRAVLLLKMNRAQEGYNLLQKQSVAKTNGGSLSWLVLNARLLMALNRFDEARALIEPFIKAHPVKTSERPTSDKLIATYSSGPNFSSEESDRGVRNVSIDARNFYAMTYVWEKQPNAITTKKNLELVTATPIARVFTQGTTPEQAVEIVKDEKLDKNIREIIEPLAMGKLIAANRWDLATVAFEHLSSAKAKKDFAQIGKAVEALSKDEKNAEANARVGLFLANIEPTPSIFAPCENQKYGKITTAMEFYLKALDGFKANEKTKNPLEATLLRGMLICFKDHYGAPYCGPLARKWDDKTSLPVSARQAWWKRLQKRFPTSKEAKETKIYW